MNATFKSEKRFDFTEDRVRANTDPEINQRIDDETDRRIRLYANQDATMITRRLEELEQEWDMERILETNASSLILGGLFLGATVSRKWLLIPFAVAGFLLQHAIQGWCPPVPLLRRRGVRTRREIDRERYALKLLRGDFDSFKPTEKWDVNRILDMVGRN